MYKEITIAKIENIISGLITNNIMESIFCSIITLVGGGTFTTNWGNGMAKFLIQIVAVVRLRPTGRKTFGLEACGKIRLWVTQKLHAVDHIHQITHHHRSIVPVAIRQS